MKSESDAWEAHLAAYGQADALYQAGQLRAAVNVFRAALALAPFDADTLWALGDCCSELGQARKAERWYRAALRRVTWGRRGDLLYNIANALLDQGQPLAAIKLYSKIPRKAGAYDLAQRNIRLARRRLAKTSS